MNDKQHPNEIRLIVVAPAGDYDGQFNVHQTVDHVKRVAMRELRIDLAAADKYDLVYNGTPLPGGSSLLDLHLPDGAELLLESQPEVA